MSHSHPSQGFALTSQELDDFHERGIAGPFRLYDPQEMDASLRRLRPRLLNAREAIYKGDEAVSGVTNISNYDRHFDVPFLAEHICRHEIVDRLASIIGPDIICWRTEFFPKYPGDEGTDWHQAGTFANVATSKKPQIVWPEGSGGRGTLTVWTAFTESSVENGCLQVIPGSHRTIYYDENKVMEYDAGRINKVDKGGTRRGFFGYDYRQLQVDPDWRPDESQAVSLVMRPGEFVIFWSTLLHASHPHAGMTKNMRLGFSARYVPTSVRVYPYSSSLDEFGGKANLDNYRAVLVSGKDEYGHNPLATHTGDGALFQHRPGLADQRAPLEHER